jgi:thioredoxin reductase (NADPH)
MPVILAVATDDTVRSALDGVLRRRYGLDYSVAIAEHPTGALGQLAGWRDAGEQVALLLAPFRMAGSDGIPFLVEAHRLHPTARRVLVLDVGDVTAADELAQALTLNQVDS